MDQIRQQILQNAEDVWEVSLEYCEVNIETKKYFRDQFGLEISEIAEWMKPGKILLWDVPLKKAALLESEMSSFNIKVSLKQTGKDYIGMFSENAIAEMLTSGNSTIKDYAVTISGILMVRDQAHVIEDNNLATACLRYVLEFGAPVID